jgi:gluconokinase
MTARRDALAVVVKGPAGAGKTTLGRALAAELGWAFHDADDYHATESVARMRSGVPLRDEDRTAWLAAQQALVARGLAASGSQVVACSALTRDYRRALVPPGAEAAVRFVYLRADAALLDARLRGRRGHFFGADLLASQLATLQAPADGEPVPALAVDAGLPVESLVRQVRAWLGR